MDVLISSMNVCDSSSAGFADTKEQEVIGVCGSI